SSTDQEALAQWLHDFMNLKQESRRVAEPRLAYAEPERFLTLEEYMQLEASSSLRHEYVNGSIYAMSGPSLAHARITRELFFAVGNHLRGGSCEVFSVDVKLMIRNDAEEIVYYPDLLVACNREEWGANFVCNPKLVAETLSPSTQHIDRREKAM